MWNKNYDQMMYGSWDMVRDRRMEGRKKWHVEEGTHLKMSENCSLLCDSWFSPTWNLGLLLRLGPGT